MSPPSWRGWPTRLLLMCQVLLLMGMSAQQYSYTRDCTDQHHKEIKCHVQLFDCLNDSFMSQRVNASANVPIPDEPHDIRVEPFAKAVSRRLGEPYQLTVDISWQTPPNNSTKLLRGFFVDIESEDLKTHLCFLFNVSESNWTKEAVKASPRLHFSTESLFRFDKKYDITVYSLPESASTVRKSARKHVVMPHNPRLANFTNLLSPNCSQYSHPYASKWTAGFRRIILHPLTRTIQIEFVGAPAQYCFEQYEIRLLDETGLELLHTDVISVEQMQTERIDNNTIFFGQYNFTNLYLDRNYIPSVIAVERASDGRCLCPVYGTNPYDSTVVCSCIAADWKPVKLQKIKTDNYVVVNSTIPLMTVNNPDSNGWVIYLILVASIFGILTCVAFLLISVYRHYNARGKTVRIRFIQDRSRNTHSTSSNQGYDPNGQSKVLLESSTAASTTVLLNNGNNLNLLIVYAHDSPEHDAAVLALADFLCEAFNFDVHLDVYDSDKIEHNLMDYMSSSVLNADKILIINSMGAAQRYQIKIRSVHGSAFIVEHNQPTPFDSLFVQQIDMVLQHHSVISVRFDFSQFNEVLMPLYGYLQYVLPGNLTPLVSALTASNLKNDVRLTGSHPILKRLSNAIEAQKAIISADPSWFAHTHHRRRIATRQSNLNLTTSMAMLPDVPTLMTLPIADKEEDFLPVTVAPKLQVDKTATLSEKEVPIIQSGNPSETDEVTSLPVLVQVHTIQNAHDIADSGVYDDSRFGSYVQSLSDAELTEERIRMPSVPEEKASETAGQTRLFTAVPAQKFIKKPVNENMDSGMISDADLQLISSPANIVL